MRHGWCLLFREAQHTINRDKLICSRSPTVSWSSQACILLRVSVGDETCRGEEHTTRRPIPWGMFEYMPHLCVRRHGTDKSVTKGLPFATQKRGTGMP